MCGLLGLFSLTRDESLSDCARSGLYELRHRGPDDNGINTFDIAGGILFLAHSRLSIIDLSIAGHQPMSSQDGRYAIVFNGEIYNYKELRKELHDKGCSFTSDSDTEVLLAAWRVWGEACIRRLKGMFAFAVLDRQNNTLTCVRDAFGIKPFFMRRKMATFYFHQRLPHY